MSTNIKGLDSLVGAIDQKISHVDLKHTNLDIQGGAGILVTRLGANKYVINLNDKSLSSMQETYPWSLIVNRDEENDSHYVSTLGGTINGYLPDNWEDIGTVSEEDELLHVVLKCNTNYNGITSATLSLEEEVPDTNRLLTLNSIPTSFDLLIGIVARLKVTNQLYKRHISARPSLAYSFENLGRESDLDHYYTWAISENL